MVAQINRHDIKWLSPAPMWNALGDLAGEDGRNSFIRPAILRFNHDNFMQELLALMSYYPDRLGEWRVKPETWREPMATPKTAAKLSLAEPVSDLSKRQISEQAKREAVERITLSAGGTALSTAVVTQKSDKPLKLYQPTQQRFYLVTASLVCRRSGLPDRFIDPGKQEQPGFVLRRLVPKDITIYRTPDVCNPDECDEYALVQTADGQQWRNISQHSIYRVDQAVPDEERLPMFSIGYTDTNNRKRKLLSGFIPVGKREAYLSVPMFDEAAAAAEELLQASDTAGLSDRKREALKQLFEMQVAGPWKGLIEQAENEKQKQIESDLYPPPINANLDGISNGNSEINSRKISREQIQTLSWYVLVDLMHYLDNYIHDVYLVIKGSKARADLTRIEEGNLYDALAGVVMSTTLRNALNAVDYHTYGQIKINLLSALQAIISNSDIEKNLDEVDEPYDQITQMTNDKWPAFLFPMADPEHAAPLPQLSIDSTIIAEPDISLAKINALTELIALALPVTLQVEAPEVVIFRQSKLDSNDGWFVIRCMHEQPNCGPFFPAVLSKPTESFKMASFFDPDAPGRPVRIPMPIDISPAGLRKFNKNTTFMISDMLCGKIKNIRKITFGDLVLSVLPWPFHKDLPRPSKTGPCGSPSNNFGMFCSLSIPIVTLCAIILLIIMVALFDLFFRWLPLLFVCFPIPGFKGKK